MIHADTFHSRFWTDLSSSLPLEVVGKLRYLDKIIVWDGDITKPGFGLPLGQLEIIEAKVSIMIHAASTIHLTKPLDFMREQIIEPSVALAELSLRCKHLTRFVYVSSAYASTFLRFNGKEAPSGSDAILKEDINSIIDDEDMSLSKELANVRSAGSSIEFNFVQHLSSYTYAKHLTERLILQLFDQHGKPGKLLILRPSLVGPADSKPFEFYERPGSAPLTAFTAGYLLSPPRKWRVSSYLSDISKYLVDEIPVDIVVNRLIMHTAAGTKGCVHAVAGIGRMTSISEALSIISKRRRLWWGRPTFDACRCHWRDKQLWPVARLFNAVGCAFQFEDTKTEMLWGKMNSTDKVSWPLWSNHKGSFQAVNARINNAKSYMVECLSVPRFIADLLIW